jgi:hypothetical protein
VTNPTELGDTVEALLAAGAVDVDEHVIDSDAPDLLSAVVPAGYRVELVDLSAFDHLRRTPRRVKGHAVVTDTKSWLEYYAKHEGDAPEVFGDVRASTVTARRPGVG